MRQKNRELEDRHAQDAAEIARLADTKDWSLGKTIVLATSGIVTGAAGYFLYKKHKKP